jgi:tetratricopeptide (TPR) repeat protein
VVGEPVELVLADDLKVGDAIVVKKGARVLGTILEGRESEKKRVEAHQLKIRADFLKAGDVRIKLRGEEAAAGKRNKKAMAAGAAALGVCGLLLASQKRYVFEEGTPVKAYVDEDVEVAGGSSNATFDGLGLALKRKGDLDGGIAESHEAIRLNPDLAGEHYNLGLELATKGDWDGAIVEFRKALHLNPNLVEAHGNLGIALGQKLDWDGAIVEFREVLRLNPNLAEAHFGLGTALENEEHWHDAIAEFRKAILLKPNYSEAHSNLGLTLQMKGDLDGAIAESREAVRLKPDNADAHRGLGGGLSIKGDIDGAIAEYREAIRLKPDDVWAHYNLGSTLEQKGDRQGALEEYEAALKLAPDNPGLKANCERLHAGLNGAALAATAQSRGSLPGELSGGTLAAPAQSRESLPSELSQAETAIEAAEAYEEFTSDEDEPPLPKKDAAEKEPQLRIGLSSADADLTRYIKKKPRDVRALLLQVCLDEVKGQVFPLGYAGRKITRAGMPAPERDPQETLDLILQIDPQNAEAYYREARYWGMLRVNLTPNHSFMRQADFAKASRFTRMAAERAPENVEYRETLATYLNAQGKAAEAMEALKTIQGANDPRYRLLIGETKISVPEGSAFDTDQVEQILPLAQEENLDFPALRLRAFLYPGPLSKVQEFYQQRWKDFRLQQAPGGDANNSKFAIFEWQGDTLQFSPQPVTEANTKKAQFLLVVGELTNLTKEAKGRLFWKELLGENPSDVACFIFMVNRRRF